MSVSQVEGMLDSVGLLIYLILATVRLRRLVLQFDPCYHVRLRRLGRKDFAPSAAASWSFSTFSSVVEEGPEKMSVFIRGMLEERQ
jgi:hypothetical protein